jgi:WD40 repeat protein/DNA-binding SARP family transcriptional activator/ABC-type Fe3+/spermidine/putrescine transport system ATPase subunit
VFVPDDIGIQRLFSVFPMSQRRLSWHTGRGSEIHRVLELRLLGQFEVRVDDALVALPSRPAQSLLAYLVLTAGTPHRRERLAALLWPDAEENNARSYLRHALWRTRKAVEAGLPEDAQYLLADDLTVAFNSSSSYWLDVAMLDELSHDGAASTQRLLTGLGLYRGELLPGFFDEWAVHERERLEAVFERQMDRLLECLVSERRWPEVLDWGERWLARGHAPEPAFRALMLAHSELGNRTGVAAVYRRCREAMFEELGAHPSPQTRDLFERLSRGERVLPASSNGRPVSDLNQTELEEAPAPGEPPFQGLQYFDEADADRFFGREQLVDRLVERLQTERFLTLVGASGSGKSSIVRAGLVPTLRKMRDFVDTIHVLTPTARPLEALASKLASPPNSPVASLALLEALAHDPRSLRMHLRRTLPCVGHALLVVDQFEELFTLCRDPFEREAFVDNLLAAAHDADAPTSVVLTLRADFYTHCAQHADLCEAVAHHQEYLGLMTAEELRRTIEGPAELGGWSVEPGLVDLLLREVGDEPGALPLLSHALLETWRRRRGRRLTLRGYTDSGGVRGAIARTAEVVFHKSLTAEQQAIARRVFLRLTELGEGTQDTRRRAALDELGALPADPAAVHQVLQVLADARLVTLGEATAEVAHEALIREWPTLRAWLDEDRAGLRLHRQLTDTTHEWERQGHDPDLLYRGARLAQIREWSETHAADLNPSERDFLNASVQLAERAVRTLRRRALSLAAALVLALVAAAAAIFFGDQARKSTLVAEANARTALARELAAATISNLEVDPERSLLLGLQAANVTYRVDGSVASEAEEALHRAVLASRMRLTLTGHTADVNNVAFSPDGNRIATVSLDGTAKIWDASTGQQLQTLVGHAGPVRGVAFGPDGQRVATAGDDRTARIWSSETGEELRTLRGYSDRVIRVAFSPDGRSLAATSLDRTARLWDVASGEQVAVLSASEGLQAIAFSSDGRKLAAGGANGLLRVWDLPSGHELLTWVDAQSSEGIRGIAFSPDGRRLASAANASIGIVWDATTGQTLSTLIGHTNQVYSLDGTMLATGGLDRKAKVWDASTGRELLTLSGHTAAVNAVAFSPDGTRLATASWDRTARVWDIGPSRELLAVPARGPGRVAFSSDGARLAFGLFDGTVQLWDASTGAPTLSLRGHADAANGVAFSPDGRLLASTSWDRTARLWDLATGQPLHVLAGYGDRVTGVAFSPDGKRLVAASNDRTARVWDVASGVEQLAFHGHSANVWGAAFSPDGTRVLTTAYAPDATARLWDANSGTELLVLRGHTDTVWYAAFSPDGQRIATASRDGSTRLWDTSSGHQLQELRDHTSTVVYVAFSPDGRRLATSSRDGTAKLWDIATGRMLLTLYGSGSGLGGVAFNSDGTHLATNSDDGVRVYVLPVEELMSLARSRLTRGWTPDECTKFLHMAVDACGVAS